MRSMDFWSGNELMHKIELIVETELWLRTVFLRVRMNFNERWTWWQTMNFTPR